MALISLCQLLEHAAENGYGVPAFNVNNLEQTRAIMEAADEEDGIGAEGIPSHDQLLTDPEEAAQFVAATDVDALAIACGTSHGAYTTGSLKQQLN